MRKIQYVGVLGLFFFFIYTSQVWADMSDSFDAMRVISGQSNNVDTDKDINDDGKVGLPEAIYPLQVVSGLNKKYYTCGAYVVPGVWKEFDCYNLAAQGKLGGDDPFIPSWKLIGGYWQWGRKGPDPGQWHDTNTPHFAYGPTGPYAGQANEGEISGWDTTYAPDGAWSDSHKTANDPCPAGFRVPTKSQWYGVLINNIQSTVGSWSESETNYRAARFFGDKLMLPSAGLRYGYGDGALLFRGLGGAYWSSSEYSSSYYAWSLYLFSDYAVTYVYYRRDGFSVRCITE